MQMLDHYGKRVFLLASFTDICCREIRERSSHQLSKVVNLTSVPSVYLISASAYFSGMFLQHDGRQARVCGSDLGATQENVLLPAMAVVRYCYSTVVERTPKPSSNHSGPYSNPYESLKGALKGTPIVYHRKGAFEA